MWNLPIIIAIIIFTLFHCVITMNRFKDYPVFTGRSNELMQRIVIHNRTREVFVGARNTIFHFHKNLSLIAKETTGPELDNINCLYPDISCEYKKQETDNDNKILDIYYSTRGDILFACGTLYQGICYAMNATNINSRKKVGNSDDVRSFTAGRNSTYGFFAPGPNSIPSLYSASTYDERPLKYSPMSVSSKIPRFENNAITFKYSYESETSHTYVNFESSFKTSYKVNYVYGFSYNGFSYFVTTQRISPNSNAIESRLVRICQNDLEFFSYTEIPILCPKGGLDYYNLATSAYLGPVGSKLKNKLKMSSTVEDILYITFGMTVPDNGYTIDHTKGSVLCSFPMDYVQNFTTNAIQECFRAEPRTFLSKHIIGIQKNCDKHDNEDIGIDFCGSALNRYIEGRESVYGGFRIHLNHDITSMAVTLQRGVTIAIMGTSNGDIIKETLENRTHQLLYIENIGKDNDGKIHPIERSNAFDHDHQNIYFLTGNKVVKFPIGSCSVYKDCSSCFNSYDPLQCGWCGDHCAYLEECDEFVFYKFRERSCPPFIYEMEPLYGPLAGGTKLIIIGDNFGSSQNGNEKSNIEIKVSGVDCDIILWEKEKVICQTQPVLQKMTGPVSISVNDTSWEFGEFDMTGTVLSSKNFSYVLPVINHVSPLYGPLSGGTNVTMYGRYLNAGSNRTITIGKGCQQYGVSENISWCLTAGFTNDFLNSDNPIKMDIDQTSISPKSFLKINESSTVFRILPDPDITKIDPQTALISGISNLTISGRNLNSVFRPKMKIIVTSTLTGNSYEIKTNCTLSNNIGTEMLCPTPYIDIPHLYPPTDKAPIVAHMSFEMDGVKKLSDLYKLNPRLTQLLYYPDPILSLNDTSSNGTHLSMKGKYLNLASSPRDVKVLVDGNQICNVTFLSSDTLLCNLFDNEKISDSKHSVIVYIRHVKFSSENVEFFTTNVDTKQTAIIVLIVLILTIVLIGIICYFTRRLFCGPCTKKQKESSLAVSYTAEHRRQEMNDYQDLAGRRLMQRPSVTSSDLPCNSVVELNPAAASHTEDEDDNETLHLLKSENILIQKEYLNLYEIIGEGYFGCVYRGKLSLPGKGEPVIVAVKTLHNSSTRNNQDLESFLQEGLMMKDFHHRNVLTLIGVCYENNKSPMVIIPYMKYGDLLSFIRSEDQNLTIKNLMTFGVDISAGMAYLSELKFIHRDLAARNCMLDEDFTVKVADFGLSRDIYERDYYSSDNNKKLPIKWMAPESLEKGTYTSKSDVWSFGIVLWELFTRGVLPYPDVDNWDLLHYLKSGRRSPQPSFCPDALYEIMLQCWDFDPKKRPNFVELENKIKSIITKLEGPKRRVSLNVTYVNYPQIVAEASNSETN